VEIKNPSKKIVYVLIGLIAAVILANTVWLVIVASSARPIAAPAQPIARSLPVISSSSFQESVSPVWGRYLTDAEGRTLYTYTHDKVGLPRCVFDCLIQHPGYGPKVGDNTSASLAKLPANIGIIGSLHGPQFTWNGLPLYYFIGDTKPSDINGAGNQWHVVN